MPDFDDLSEGLKMEVLTEMADTYFGARKELDVYLEEFDKLTDALARLAHKVLVQAGLVHALLLGKRGAPGFYQAIGVDPAAVPFALEGGPVAHSFPPPWALTGRGRWRKTLKKAYARYRDLAHDYMHGHPEPDPKMPKRKRMSLHYGRLKALAEHINGQIRHVNEDLSMRDALDYARHLDPRVAERERVAGGGQYEEQHREQDFVPIDFEHLGIKPVPDLPPARQAWAGADRWLDRFYRENKDELGALLERMRRGEVLAGRPG